MEENKKPELTKKQQTAIAISMIMSVFILTFNASALNLAIPLISGEFHSQATLTGWIVTSYILVTAMLAIPFGRIADLTGRRRIFLIGLASFVIFSVLIIFVPNIEQMLILRVLTGVSGAMFFATNIAILVNSFPREQTGRVLGLNVMFVYIGLSLGPVVGGVLTHNFGWRSIFMLTSAIALISFVVAVLGIPKKSSDSTAFKDMNFKEINPLGILLYTTMIFALMFGFTEIAHSYISWIIICIGIILFIIFIRHELKTSRPLLELRLFRNNPNFVLSNMASFLNYGATFAVSYLMSIYLQLVLDFDAQISGFILISQPLLQAIVSPISGRMSDKYSPFRIATVGMSLCAIALISYIFVNDSTPIWHIFINLALMGIGVGIFSSPNNNAIMSSVSPQDSSLASSMIATMRSLGHVVSMAILTLIIGSNLGDSTFSQAPKIEIVATMRTAFIVFAVICVVGIFFSMQRKKKKPSSEAKPE